LKISLASSVQYMEALKEDQRGRNTEAIKEGRFEEFEISFGKTRYSVIPRLRGRRPRYTTSPNHTKGEMENKSDRTRRPTTPLPQSR